MSGRNEIQWCGCHQRLGPRQAMADIISELGEFIAEPSRDELSDIAYGIGRLLGSVVRRSYVRVPGDRRHVAKIQERMVEYGCIRSRRHLVDGACPKRR